MEKQEFKSKWDELAREIGVEIPPEIEQREVAAPDVAIHSAEPAPAQPTRAAATAHASLPKRSAVDWDSLAGELGLPPAEAPPPTEEPRPAVERREPPRLREAPPQRQRTERRDRTEQPPRREPRERRPPHGRREERGRGRQRDRNRPREFDRDVEREPREEPAQPRAEATPPPEPAAPRQPEEAAKPAPGVSLWHKIFGLPAEQSAKVSEISRKEDRDETEPPGRPYERSSGTLEPPEREEEETIADVVEELEADFEIAPEADDEASREQKRGRSRRRRRGGRGRRREGDERGERPQRAERVHRGAEPDQDFEDLEESEIDRDSEAELAVAQRLAGDMDAENEEDEAHISHSERSKSAAQRAIPSWEEAIGFIVDANMQNRSQRRGSRSDARGNGSRGRRRR